MLQYLIPFYDPDVHSWSLEARLLRWLTFLWIFIGLIALFSASYPVANLEMGDGLYYFKRQLIWIWVGMLGLNVIVRSPLKKYSLDLVLDLFIHIRVNFSYRDGFR